MNKHIVILKLLPVVVILFLFPFVFPSIVDACNPSTPPPPTNLMPNGTTSAGTTNITWSPVTGITTYLIRIHDNAAGPWNCITQGTEVCTSTTTASYPYNFQLNHTYNVWVHAQNSCGAYSDPDGVTVSLPNTVSTPSTYNPVNPTYLYVDPNGNDANPGTLSQPFQTIAHARDVVRGMNQNMSGDIVVYLRGGYYPQSSTFALTNTDSGTNGHYIIYKNYGNEVPLISGGQTVTGWQQTGSGNIWKAYVGVGVQSRQVYVNGVRATRARTDGLPSGTAQTTTGFTTSDTSLASLQNPSDIEVVTRLSGWKEFRCGVQSISGKTIVMKQPCFQWALAQAGFNMNTISWLENAYEFVNQPGEWYLNSHTGWLYYIPRSSENMTTASVILPTLEMLTQVQGTPDNPVKNIRLQGLVFAYTTWLGPNSNNGYAHLQAEVTGNGAKTPANVTVSCGQNIFFDRDIFTHLGAVGLNIGVGSKTNTVDGNYFTDISAASMTIGEINEPNTTDDREIVRDNLITDNIIHDVAVEYQGSVGIMVGYTQHTTISHNVIYNLPYTGISIGWGWSPNITIAKNNIIENNLIYNVMENFADGGGIYSLSAQPGNDYTNNVVHDVYQKVSNSYKGTSGLYLDDGSTYITLDHNVVYNVSNTAQTKGSSNTISCNDPTACGTSATVVANANLEGAYQSIATLPTLPNPSSTTPPASTPTPIQTPTPTPTLKLTPTPTSSCKPGDLNCDGKVDIYDYNILVSNFGHPYTIFDYNNLVANFGK